VSQIMVLCVLSIGTHQTVFVDVRLVIKCLADLVSRVRHYKRDRHAYILRAQETPGNARWRPNGRI